MNTIEPGNNGCQGTNKCHVLYADFLIDSKINLITANVFINMESVKHLN